MHKNEPIEHTALLDHSIHISIEFHERGFEKPASPESQANQPGGSVKLTTTVLEDVVQFLVDRFFTPSGRIVGTT